jgi:hypothetical protein
LTITAPAAGSNIWTATDSLGTGPGTGTGRGQYTFAIAPTIASDSYSAGNALKVGNYVLSASGLTTVTGYATNYHTDKAIIYNNGVLSITPKTITVTGTTVADKVYDATTVASLTRGSLAGAVASDAITLIQAGRFTSANVSSSPIAITATNSLTGADAANYVLTQPTGLSASIAPAPVTISGLSAVNKVYNTNATAVITGAPIVASGLLGSDTATIASGTATVGSFASVNVGTDIVVTADLSGLALDNSNYYIGGVTTALKAAITPKPVTIGGLTASNKVYNATTVATLTGTPGVTAGDLLGGDTATISGTVTVGVFDSADAGYSIGVNANISGLTISNPNYYITGLATPLRANITPAPISVSVVKPYDGGVTVTFDQMTVTGIGGQTLSFAPGSIATISSSADFKLHKWTGLPFIKLK